MADLFDKNIAYEAAKSPNQSIGFVKKLKIFADLNLVGVKLIFFLIVDLVIGLLRIFVPVRPKNIEGQVVLITGGGNGIGKQLALQFAREKCKVAVVDIDFDAATKTADEIQAEFKVTAKAFRTDVSNVEQIEKLRLSVEESLGCVDILVNNAGILTTSVSLFEGSHADIKRIIDINMSSHFWVSIKFSMRRHV